MDENCLDYEIPKDDYVFKPMLNKEIFGGFEPSKKTVIPSKGNTKINTMPSQNQLGKLRKINADDKTPIASIAPEISDLSEGMQVEHARFGYGKVLKIEGKGNDRKALIDFKVGGKKNLLLRFAKLKIKG